MRNILILLSSIVTIVATLPYIIDIIKGKTKPRVVSWFTWAMLTSITAAASLSDHQYPAAILSMSATFECLLVVVLGLKYGTREFTVFDVACQLAALAGLLLWLVYNSPAIAVVASIVIDLVGSLPTLKHAWQKPAEETWITFALSGLGAAFAAFAASSGKITAIANPLYIVVINTVFTIVLIGRHKIVRII